MKFSEKEFLIDIVHLLDDKGWKLKKVFDGEEDIPTITIEQSVEDAAAVEEATLFFQKSRHEVACFSLVWGNDYGELIYDSTTPFGFDKDLTDVEEAVFGKSLTEEFYFKVFSSLPPVGCDLLIEVANRAVLVERKTYVTSKDAEVTYTTKTGREIVGRFNWTYP